VLVNLLLGIGAALVLRILIINGLVHPLATAISGTGMYWFVVPWSFSQNDMFPWAFDLSYVLPLMLLMFAKCNIAMAIFNLFPAFPFAMNKLVIAFSSSNTIVKMTHYEKPLQVIMVLLLVFDGMMHQHLGFGIIQSVIRPLTTNIISRFIFF